MAEPFKNVYNEVLITALGQSLKRVYNGFDSKQFHALIFDEQWQQRELKERIRHISLSLGQCLPNDYHEAIAILKTISHQFNGLVHIIFPDFVEVYGLEHYDTSIAALGYFTEQSSSEFAIRPFIKKYPTETMVQMAKWTTSNNHHLRRLASEGCRPRLPWAMALPEFKHDPTPVIDILKRLKNDDSDYVQRSVANNLNDISKDNPNIIVSLAKQWHGQNRHTDWIVKHGCRTLLKNGHPEILALFGFKAPHHIKLEDFKLENKVRIGNELKFSFQLTTEKKILGKLRIEYAIDHLKNNGKLSRKIFKISESDCQESTKNVSKQHSFKQITTRKYYAGTHRLAIIVNGHELISKEFLLTT